MRPMLKTPPAMIGISAVAREENFRLMLEMNNQTERSLSLFREGLIDGAILMGIKQNSTLVTALLEEHYSFVLIGDYLGKSDRRDRGQGTIHKDR